MDVSGEGLGGHVPTRECGGVVALCGEVGVVQPNVGLKRTGVNTYLVLEIRNEMRRKWLDENLDSWSVAKCRRFF